MNIFNTLLLVKLQKCIKNLKIHSSYRQLHTADKIGNKSKWASIKLDLVRSSKLNCMLQIAFCEHKRKRNFLENIRKACFCTNFLCNLCKVMQLIREEQIVVRE